MKKSKLNSQWTFDPRRPSLSDYPALAKDLSALSLDDDLKDIGEYQRRLWANRKHALLLVVHGLDASGKDSLIRTLATWMDPTAFHAWSFGRPEGDEVRHDFLWRVVPYLPAYGEVVAFNRSHHEAVMAERLWPVRDESTYDWHSRYGSIRAFERHLVDEGTTIIKCWLHLSRDEHRKRLRKRLTKSRKIWKFHESDIDAWEKRDTLLAYASEAIAATSTDTAPWLIIPADDKKQARTLVAAIVAEQLRRLAPDYPAEDKGVLKIYRELLDADLSDG